MANYSPPIQNLMNVLARLPGIGMRSAERITFHLLKLPAEEAYKIADAIRDVKSRVKNCSTCFNLTESDPCSVCADVNRDQSTVCIVEQPKDLLSLEAAGLYKGVYHVLLGRLSPLDGVGAGDLTIASLMDRLDKGVIREVIMGTNPTLEGDTTSLYIQNEIQQRFPGVQVTRLARGLASGSSIEFANRNMLAEAIAGRHKVQP